MRTVGESMSDPVLVGRASTIQEASARMLDGGAAIAVVVDDGAVAGLVVARDVARALANGVDVSQIPVESICEPDPPLARPNESLLEVHDRIRARHRPVAVAVGPHRQPLGVVTFSS